MWYGVAGMAGGSHGCGATDYCIVGGRGSAPGTVEISRSRTEPANRVERARIILAYLEEPSAYVVARAIGVSQQTVTRCLERAAELGVLAALDDRARTGREATITAEPRTGRVGVG